MGVVQAMGRTLQTSAAFAPIEVGAAIVVNAAGRVLMAERRADQLSPGFWELPGGKVEPGETPASAALRELYEETSLTGRTPISFAVHLHRFGTRLVRLHLFRVVEWSGTPQCREGQRLAWVDPAAPSVGPLLPSNLRAMRLLGLPPLAVFTESGDAGGPQAAFARLERLLRLRRALVVVREPGLAPGQLAVFAQRVTALARGRGITVLVAAAPTLAQRVAAAGIHDRHDAWRRRIARPDVALWSVSCRSAEDVGAAAALGADLAFVAPVLPTAAHPGTEALGFAGLARIAAAAPLPLYAQGGLRPRHEAEALAAGAAGAAMSSGVWDDRRDP
jgi:8-oxo-dGTP diphosphatase